MNEQDPFGLVGRTLDGQYRVEAFVGEGSFSAVYRGMQDGLGEACAIKCLKLPGGLEPQLMETFVRRFRDESKLHYRLAQGNLNIARSLSAGSFAVLATGLVVPYIVLEWLEGRTLAQEIHVRREVGDGPMVIEEAVRILRTAADALAFAHSQGVVHRDVTPSNLFLLRAAHPPRTKVLDFGLAKVVSDHAMDLGPRAPTMGYLKLFSPAYAAPEQFDQRYGVIGPWTDVYAFAQILVELQLGRSPSNGDSIADYAQLAMQPDRRPTPRAFGVAIGDALEHVFVRALQVDPQRRYPTMGDFWADLTRAVEAQNGPHTAQFAHDDDRTHVSSVDEMRGIMDGLRSVGVNSDSGAHPNPVAGAGLASGSGVQAAGRSTARLPPSSPSLGAPPRGIGVKAPLPRPSQPGLKLRTSSPAFARTSVDPQLARPGTSADKFAATSKAFPAPQGALPATPPWQLGADATPPVPSTAKPELPSFTHDEDESTVIRALDEDLEVIGRAKAAARPAAGMSVDPHAATSKPAEDPLTSHPGARGDHRFGATFAMADPIRNQVMPEPLPAPAMVPQSWQGQAAPGMQPPMQAASGPMASMIGGHHQSTDHGSGSFPFTAAPNAQQPYGQQPFAQQPFAHQGGSQGPFALPLSGLPEQRGPGGAIASNYAAPGAPTPPVADMYAVPAKASSRRGLYLALGVLGILLLTGISFAITRAVSARKPDSGGVTAASASPVKSAVPISSASAAPPPEPPAVPSSDEKAAEPPAERPAEKPGEKPAEKPGEKPAEKLPQPVGPKKFNAALASGSLASHNAQIGGVCSRKAGPSGSGRATVTFGNTGKVTNVVIAAPFAGSDRGNCASSYYHQASVPPFEGPAGTASAAFNIAK